MGGIVSAKPLFNRPEQILYGRLMRAFPGHVILAHVAVSRFLVVDRTQSAEAAAVGHRFRQSVVDFVVCKSDFEAIAVVELDRSHPKAAQTERERRKDRYLQAAGIKVIRVRADDIPNEPGLKALVATLPAGASTTHLMRRAS